METTYWQEFLAKYPNSEKMELVKVLEAFFYFSKNQIGDCEKILLN